MWACCCAFDKCPNQRKKYDAITYFSFPKSSVLLEQWLHFVNQHNDIKLTTKTLNRDKMKICHLHFEKKQIIIKSNKDRALMRDAVPCCPPGIIDEGHFTEYMKNRKTYAKKSRNNAADLLPQKSYDGKPPLYHSMNGYMVDLRIAALQDTFRLPTGKMIQVRRQKKEPSPATPTPPQSLPLQKQSELKNSENDTELQSGSSRSIQKETQSAGTPATPKRKADRTSEKNIEKAHKLISPASIAALDVTSSYKTYSNKRVSNHSSQKDQAVSPRSSFARPSSTDLITLHEETNGEATTVELPTTIDETILFLNQRKSAKRSSGRSGYAGNSQRHATPASESVQSRRTTETGPRASLLVPPLTAIQCLLYKDHKNNEFGTFQEQFDNQLMSVAEVSLHVLSKVNTILNSNPYKTAASRGDLKELYGTVSYIMKYAIDRFQGLEENATNNIRCMGFTEQSATSPVLEEQTSANGTSQGKQSSSEVEQDDDCAIIEQQPDLIEIDSDDESDVETEKTNGTPSYKESTMDPVGSDAESIIDDENVCDTSTLNNRIDITTAESNPREDSEETPSPMDESEELQVIMMQETTETTEITYFQEDADKTDELTIDLKSEPLNIEASDVSMEEEEELIDIIEAEADADPEDGQAYKVVDIIDGDFYLLSQDS